MYDRAREVARAARLDEKCEVRRGGCYGLCHLGANVVVRALKPGPLDPFDAEDFQLTYEPGEAYYWRMTPAGIERVLREHVGEGRVAADLVGDPDAEGDFRKKG